MVAVLVSRDDALSAHERKLAEEARYYDDVIYSSDEVMVSPVQG